MLRGNTGWDGDRGKRCHFLFWTLIHKNTWINLSVVPLPPPGDDWYQCRLTLSMPSQADLQWAMFPSPYLGAVGPDAAAGSVVYRLSARQRDGTVGQAQFLLLDGE